MTIPLNKRVVFGTLGNDAVCADGARQTNETYVYESGTARGQDTVWNFDNVSGDGSSSDKIDLRSVFDNLAGKFSDGINDFADRKAALHMVTGDFDRDGRADDAQLSIDGLKDFVLTFLNPTSVGGTSFDIASDTTAKFSDILLGGTSTFVPPPTTTPPPPVATTPPPPVATTPPPVTQPPVDQPHAPPPAPSPSPPSGIPGQHAYWERLDNGVNIERSEYSKITDAELKYLHDSGVEHLRLFMTPEEYLTKGKPMDPAHNGFVQGVLSLAERANKAGLAVIIDPLAHNLFFRDNPNDQAAITMEVNWWKELASYINTRFDPKDIFLEVTNEPMLQHAEDWWKIQAQFISVMRAAAPDFTIIAASNMRDVSMGNQWDQIGALAMMKPYADPNIVYNVHYYGPFFFTHQQAHWIPEAANTGLRHYYSDGHAGSEEGYSAQRLINDFAKAGEWAKKYGVHVTMNEFGVIPKALENEKADYLHDARIAAEKAGLGWAIWDLNKSFPLTATSSPDAQGLMVLKDGFAKALTWGSYQDGDTLWDASVVSSSLSSLAPGHTEPQQDHTNSDPPSTSLDYVADPAFAKEEKFVFTAADLNRTVTVSNYDDFSSSTFINDQLDLRAVFTALGGKYTDGVNDFADRKAAIVITTVDLDHDGKADDTHIAIQGVSGFAIDLVNPSIVTANAYDIGDGKGVYDDILIA